MQKEMLKNQVFVLKNEIFQIFDQCDFFLFWSFGSELKISPKSCPKPISSILGKRICTEASTGKFSKILNRNINFSFF